MILCTDDSLYTGITLDIERRFNQHLECRGARYFRGHRPRKVVYLEHGHSRSTAGKREAAIKKLPRAAKFQLISSPVNEVSSEDFASTADNRPG